VVSFTPIYPQGNSSRHPLDRRLGGTQNQYEHGGEENSQLLFQKYPAIELARYFGNFDEALHGTFHIQRHFCGE
jgi:hypothetical protein